jgi:hypothetical protein
MAESAKEGYGSKRAVLPMMMMMRLCTAQDFQDEYSFCCPVICAAVVL